MEISLSNGKNKSTNTDNQRFEGIYDVQIHNRSKRTFLGQYINGEWRT